MSKKPSPSPKKTQVELDADPPSETRQVAPAPGSLRDAQTSIEGFDRRQAKLAAETFSDSARIVEAMEKAYGGPQSPPDIRLTMLSDKVCIIEAVNGLDRKELAVFGEHIKSKGGLYAVLAPEGLKVEVTR